MRTFTVVPSFEGESAFFELPDIGFQGDHLSFAILFNLTELTEHWPNIFPSMIVTDPKGNTFIAPSTSWNPSTHIFTWNISSTETTYEGYVLCQLKCTAADDPTTIVCMSRICQTRVYASLAAAEDPPEAFQSWIDTLTQLGAQVQVDASAILDSVETTQVNARTAQSAAEEASMHENAVQQIRIQTEHTAQIAVNAQGAASQAQQRAQIAASAAQTAQLAAETAKEAAETALEETDAQAKAAATSASSATDSATRSATSMINARNAQTASEQARDASIVAKDASELAQERAEEAEDGAFAANRAAERAKGLSEDAAELSKKWAIGKDRNGVDVNTGDPTYENSSKYWAGQSHSSATSSESSRRASESARDTSEDYADKAQRWATGINAAGSAVDSTDPTFENSSKYWAEQSSRSAEDALNAKDEILRVNFSTASYSEDDESVTVYLGRNAVINSQGG